MHLLNKNDVKRVDPARTVHLCIDLQEEYFNPKWPGRRKTAPRKARRIQEVADAFGDLGIETIWVYHTAVSPHFYIVRPRKENTMAKGGFSAFSCTPLDNMLRSKEIDSLILSGGYTDVCVSETAIDALQKEYNVFVLLDCVEAKKSFKVSAGSLRRRFTTLAGERERAAFFVMSAPLLETLAARKASRSAVPEATPCASAHRTPVP